MSLRWRKVCSQAATASLWRGPRVLTRVGLFVSEVLECLVQPNRKQRANTWSNPCDTISFETISTDPETAKLTVDPVLRPSSAHDSWAETTRGIQAGSSPLDGDKVGTEERHTDRNRCHEPAPVVLSSHHEDGRDEVCCQNHLQADSLCR